MTPGGLFEFITEPGQRGLTAVLSHCEMHEHLQCPRELYIFFLKLLNTKTSLFHHQVSILILFLGQYILLSLRI